MRARYCYWSVADGSYADMFAACVRSARAVGMFQDFHFWAFCQHQGQAFTEEAPLAYAVHMLCGNPYAHTLRATADLRASDWTGHFAGRLPDGTTWDFVDYFTGERFPVNPAIVHAMRSKGALLASGGRVYMACDVPMTAGRRAHRAALPQDRFKQAVDRIRGAGYGIVIAGCQMIRPKSVKC